MTETIFKPGVEYRTRDGSRARVYATDGAIDEPIHGAAMIDGLWWAAQWLLSGRIYADGCTDDLDLVPPEPEPETVTLWEKDGTRTSFRDFTISPDGTLRVKR